MLHKLQYISQGATPDDHLHNIHMVLEAGVKLVQLRLKNCEENTYIRGATEAKNLCDKYAAWLIVNDSPNVAKLGNANALHLGLNDMRVPDARGLFNGVIGGTANTFEDVKQRCIENVDYIGLGPFRFTTTKEKLSPVLGLEGYRNIISQMKTQGLSTPVYAIGGIELSDMKDIMGTGVHGVAVSGLLSNSGNKEKLVKEITKILYDA